MSLDPVKTCLIFSVVNENEIISGENAEGVTPVPIPNTEVKSFRADDTALEVVWESRSLPDI